MNKKLKITLYVLTLIFIIFFITACQKAEYAKPDTQLTCISSWSCGEWSNCLNKTQLRICTDQSGCKHNDSPKMKQLCNISLTNSSTTGTTKTSTSLPSNVKIGKAGENYLEKGETITYNGKTIKLDRVAETAVMINMTGEMITLKVDQPKTNQGIKMTLIATFDTTATIDIAKI